MAHNFWFAPYQQHPGTSSTSATSKLNKIRIFSLAFLIIIHGKLMQLLVEINGL